MDDGTVSIFSFVTLGRGPALPEGAKWMNQSSGIWMRPPSAENIAAELSRSHPGVSLTGTPLPQVLTWRIIDEQDIPADRTYRDALEDNGALRHNITRARELHRNLLRAERSNKMVELDGKWMRATGQGDKQSANAIEAERQKWRDAPADPRIDAAQTVQDLKATQVI